MSNVGLGDRGFKESKDYIGGATVQKDYFLLKEENLGIHYHDYFVELYVIYFLRSALWV